MIDERKEVRLALFGESDVGKSHFGGQLLLRLNTEQCELRMNGAASNLTAFDEVTQRLNEGVPAAHTPAAVYYESVWPVADQSGAVMDLSWPDYAGEQVRLLLEERRIPMEWQDRVQSADGWVLMVRPKHAKLGEDILSRPLSDVGAPGQTLERSKRSPQSQLVELLQMLSYARRIGSGEKCLPALAILLSCWDELELVQGETPQEVFSARLPLLAAFVQNNWEPERLLVFGVSALEGPLSAEQPNERFINEGPEHVGYVVLPNGQLSPDLTLPIAQVARAARI